MAENNPQQQATVKKKVAKKKAAAKKTVVSQQANPPKGTYQVTAKQDRRRAGRAWPKGTTNVPAEDLNKEQLAQLNADPLFSVVTLSD